MIDTIYKYAVAIDSNETPKKFLDFIEAFAPRFSLRCGVHILYHTKKLTLAELREYVRSTLPENTSFWVCVPQEDEFVPIPEDEAKKR